MGLYWYYRALYNDLSQIKGTSGLLSKLTFTGEDADFLVKRQQALEVYSLDDA